MRRRAFLVAGAGLGAAAAFPVRAQQSGPPRRIAVVMNTVEKDSRGQALKDALLKGLKDRGWTDSGNLRVHYRWVGNDVASYRKHADEIVALAPEVIVVGGGTTVVRPLQQATSTIPIVFATATDPIGGGLVATLARPGGNITGLTQSEFGLRTKAVELLKQLAPQVKRVAVFRDPSTTGGVGQFAAIQAAASSFGVELTPLDVRTSAQIERGIADFVRVPGGGVIVTSSSSAGIHRKLLITLLNQHRLPAVFPTSLYAQEGGLSAYGVDVVDNYRRAAGFVDRILKGDKPAEMPVQDPSKFELVLNLRTARAIGLKIPQAVLLRADKIIE